MNETNSRRGGPPERGGPRSGGRPVSDDTPQREPFDESAEQAVLGAVLLDHRVLRDVGNMLEVEEFYRESHRAIFRAMLDLDEQSKPIDTVSLANRLRQLDLFAAAGGGSYLMDLGTRVPTAVNVRHYAELVKTKAIQRKLIQFGREVVRDAHAEVEDIATLIDSVASQAMNLTISGMRNGVVHLREALSEAVEITQALAKSAKQGGLAGVPSGFHELDAKTNGWQRGELIILAARPGMGKTAFALNILQNAASDRRGAMGGVFFSLEMTKAQLATRLWASQARVTSSNLRSGDLRESDWKKLWPAVEALSEAPIFIDDTPGLSIAEMMRKCRQLKHEHDIQLVIVDYLQLMTASTSGKNASREQQISEISRTLKVLSKELNIPVIALSQLNRGVESRTDKRPMLSDLRESGAIEQDADVIIFLYRDDYYDQMKGNNGEEGAPAPDPTFDSGHSLTEIIIAKHRSGPTGKIEINFEKAFTLFSNIGTGPPPTDADRPPDFDFDDDEDYPAPAPALDDEDFARVDFDDDDLDLPM